MCCLIEVEINKINGSLLKEQVEQGTSTTVFAAPINDKLPWF